MKTWVVWLGLVLAVPGLRAKPLWLDLEVSGVRAERGGYVVVYLFEAPEGYPLDHQRAVRRYRFVVGGERLQVRLEVPAVPYALKVHHDANDNGKVDKNWTRLIPSEGLGFSSAARLDWSGPPSFEEAERRGGGKESVVLQYFNR